MLLSILCVAVYIREYSRSHGLFLYYTISSEALFFASTVSSQDEWNKSQFSQKREFLSGGGCGKIIFVYTLKDFIEKSFPGCESNPKWGGFIVYPMKKLSRFNFPFSEENIFLSEITWKDLDNKAKNFLLTKEDYFPISTRMSIFGIPVEVNSLEELKTKISDQKIHAEGKRLLSRFTPHKSNLEK